MCKFLHLCFPADFSLYLLLKVYVQGILWGHLQSSTCIFLLLCVCVFPPCVLLYSTNYVVACLCVPAVSFLCMSAFFRNLHTPNKFWSAYVLLCVFLFLYQIIINNNLYYVNICAWEYMCLYL